MTKITCSVDGERTGHVHNESVAHRVSGKNTRCKHVLLAQSRRHFQTIADTARRGVDVPGEESFCAMVFCCLLTIHTVCGSVFFDVDGRCRFTRKVDLPLKR